MTYTNVKYPPPSWQLHIHRCATVYPSSFTSCCILSSTSLSHLTKIYKSTPVSSVRHVLVQVSAAEALKEGAVRGIQCFSDISIRVCTADMSSGASFNPIRLDREPNETRRSAGSSTRDVTPGVWVIASAFLTLVCGYVNLTMQYTKG